MKNLLGKLRCLLFTHQPIRNRVRSVAQDSHIGYCRHCGVPIKRKVLHKWKRDKDPARLKPAQTPPGHTPD